MAAGKFVIKKDPAGHFRFALVGRHDQIVATSETYTTKAACMTGIKAVRTLAADAAVEDQTAKEWAVQHEEVKAKAATRGATKTAAEAAKKAIAQAPGAKKAAKTAKTAPKKQTGRSRKAVPASAAESAGYHGA